MFNASGGSILPAALFRFQLNNPQWPDAQSSDSVFFAGVAVGVVWLNRKAMFSRAGPGRGRGGDGGGSARSGVNAGGLERQRA